MKLTTASADIAQLIIDAAIPGLKNPDQLTGSHAHARMIFAEWEQSFQVQAGLVVRIRHVSVSGMKPEVSVSWPGYNGDLATAKAAAVLHGQVVALAEKIVALIGEEEVTA